MICARCLDPIDLSKKHKRVYKRCAECRKNYHRSCFKLHRRHAHTKDDRSPFNNRKFFV